MRSKEFVREAGRNQSTDDFDTPVQSAQADAARIAQGQKNLNAIKGFFGVKPEELKDAPPGTSIDPVQRARMGYKPATQQEIAAFQAANPNYGKVVGRDGQPIKSGTPGVTWDAGGEKAVVQTAQAAAPMSKGDAHAGQQGYNTDLERIPGAAQRDQGGYNTDLERIPGAAQRDQGGYNYQEPNIAPAPRVRADRTADIQADAEAAAAAAADRDRKAIGTTERPVQSVTPPPKAAEREYDPRVYGAAHAGQGGTVPEIIRPNAMAAPGEPPVADVDVYKRSEMDDFGREGNRKKAEPVKQNATPKAGFKMSPTVWEYAINMGLIQNGKPVDAAIKAFQEKNGLKADGLIGANTSNAILSAAKPGMPNIGRGQQGGASAEELAAYKPLQPIQPPIQKKPVPSQAATPPSGGGQVIGGGRIPQGPVRPGVPEPLPGPVSTGRQPWEHTPPAPEPVQSATPPPAQPNRGTNTKYKNPPATQTVKESREIDRMRFLAGLIKD
jgi:hypothetical protein